MTEYTRILHRFEYHTEDLDCSVCQHDKKRRNRFNRHGCGERTCRYEEIRREAVKNGRIKRPKGWFRCPE